MPHEYSLRNCGGSRQVALMLVLRQPNCGRFWPPGNRHSHLCWKYSAWNTLFETLCWKYSAWKYWYICTYWSYQIIMKCTNSVCVYSLLYDVLVSLLSPNWEYNDRAGSKLTLLTKAKVVQILSTLLVLPEHFRCSQTAHCAYSLHIPRCSILPRDHWKGRWPTTALNGILLILKKRKRLPTDRKKERWRTWLHWIEPYWSCTEKFWS